jgi:hypothetical protein
MKLQLISLFIAGVVLGSAAIAQTRTEAANAAGADWSELRCTKNAAASIECSACTTTIVTDLGSEERPCSRPRVLRTVNANRIDTVGAALVPAALRQARFDVDAGSP